MLVATQQAGTTVSHTNRRGFAHALWILLIAALLAVSGCRPVSAPTPLVTRPLSPLPGGDYTPAVEPAPCPFTLPGETEGEEYVCGILRVPQWRSDPQGVQVGVFFARLSATAPASVALPLLFLAGGPGASGVYDAPLLAPTLAPLRKTRDLLFFDIRGAGFSQPRLDCAAFAAGDAGPACMAKLRAQGIKPLAFNTTQNASDAADLLAALGYAQADLLGVSYGTRLALEMVRTQPQAVRAVVLDSTVGPETLTYELQALGDYEAKLWPFADCEQTPTCRGRFGEMAGRFVALINRLDEEGAALTVGDNLLDAGALYNITHLALNRPDLIALLPLIVDELDRGATATYQALLNHEFDVASQRAPAPVYAFEQFIPRFDAYLRTLPASSAADMRARLAALPVDGSQPDALAEFVESYVAEPLATQLHALVVRMTPYEYSRVLAAYGAELPLYDHHSLGDVKLIIDCQEEIPFVDPDAVRKNQAVIPAPSLLPPYDFYESVRGEQRACLDQGIAPAPATFKDAVVSDKPMLLLSGAQDTITPALWAKLVAASLSNAHLVIFPAYGHALLYNNGPCVVQVAASFLDDPTRPVDTACAPKIDYVVEQPTRVALTGRMWRLQGWAGKAINDLPVTAFFSGGMVGGLGGCGAYRGEFTLAGDRLRIAQLAAPVGGCSEDARTLQDAFLAAFGQAQSIFMRGNRMLLTTATGELLVFTVETNLPLEDTLWTLVAAATASEDALAPVLPEIVVTARFAEGVLMGALGCNLYEATYARQDGLMLHDVRRVGDDVCDAPAGIMEQEQAVLTLLGAVRSYRVIGRELLLYGDAAEPLFVFYAATP